MNRERIKQLIKTAGGLEIQDTRGFGPLHSGYNFPAGGAESFAELIIKECTSKMENDWYGDSLDDIIQQIRKHFGV